MRRKIKYAAICSAAVLSSLLIGSTAMAREVPKWIAIRESEKDTAWEKLAMTYDGVLTGVNVRKKANAKSKVVGYIYPGCAVWVIEKGEKWTHISSGEIEGFVDNDYLLYGEDAQGIAEEYGCAGITANWDGVCVYGAPNGDSEVWGELNTGDDLVVLEDNGHWLTVEYGADKAYVSEDDVQRAFLLDAAYGLDEEYDGFESETEEYYEEEYNEEYNEEEYYEEETGEEEYYEEETSGNEEYVDPETDAPETDPPQTDAPQTEVPPQTEYVPPQTEYIPPQTEYVPPQTEAPETDPPQTDPVQTDPPETDPPQTENPGGNNGGEDPDLGDDGWYDADTDTYYDGNGNVVSQGEGGQAEAGETLPEETAAPDTGAGASDSGDADTDDGGWYDADTDTWYDGNGNVVSQGAAGQAEAEETAAPDTGAGASDSGDSDAGSGWYDADTDTWYDGNGNVISQGTEGQAEAADVNEDDAALLAALIYCEAGDQSYDGMTAVGSVVMNRVMNEGFPDSVSDVIYQSGQFSPVDNGALESALENGVPEECYDAAVAALSGECPAGDVLYFNTGTGEGEHIDDQQFY